MAPSDIVLHAQGFYGIVTTVKTQRGSLPDYQRIDIEFPIPNPANLWHLEGAIDTLLRHPYITGAHDPNR